MIFQFHFDRAQLPLLLFSLNRFCYQETRLNAKIYIVTIPGILIVYMGSVSTLSQVRILRLTLKHNLSCIDLLYIEHASELNPFRSQIGELWAVYFIYDSMLPMWVHS